MTEAAPNFDNDRRVLAEMMPRAEEFAIQSGGDMRTMAIRPEDTENFPGQTGVVVKGEPISVEGVDYIAGTVVESYNELKQNIRERSPETLSKIGELLEAGENVILVTSHGNLIDPAIALAAVSSLLREQGYKFEIAISLGKMIALLERKVDQGDGKAEYMAMVAVMQMLCDETYLSNPPNSESVKTGLREKMPEVIEEQNQLSKEAMIRGLDRGGVLLAMASSGTTHKLIDAKNHLLGKVSGGTADIMSHEKTHVVTVAMDIDGDGEYGDTYIDLISEPEQLTGREQVDEMMSYMGSWMTAKATGGKKYIYQAAEKAAEKVKRNKK
ncbi:MAG: hypothetical protein AAB436_02945 [Patescibacteria group bacterium]